MKLPFMKPQFSPDFQTEAGVDLAHKEGQVRNIIIADPGIYFDLTLPAYKRVNMNDIKKIEVRVTLNIVGTNLSLFNEYQILRPGTDPFIPGALYKILLPFPDPNIKNQVAMEYQITIKPEGAGDTYTHSGVATASATGDNPKIEPDKKFILKVGNETSGLAEEPNGRNAFAISNVMCSEGGVGFLLYWSDNLIPAIKQLIANVSIGDQQFAAFDLNPDPGNYTSMDFVRRPAVFWAPIPKYMKSLVPNGKPLRIWLQVNLGDGWIDPGYGKLEGMEYDGTVSVIPGLFTIETVSSGPGEQETENSGNIFFAIFRFFQRLWKSIFG